MRSIASLVLLPFLIAACGETGQTEAPKVRKGIGAVRALPPRLAHHVGAEEALRRLTAIVAPQGGMTEAAPSARQGRDYRNFAFPGGTLELDTDSDGNLYSARFVFGTAERCPSPPAQTIEAIVALFAPGADSAAAERAASRIDLALAEQRPASEEIPGLQLRLDNLCPVELRVDPRATGGFGKWIPAQRP